MKLTLVNYTQFEGTPMEWTLQGLTLGQVNLLVGRNATGKSRCINIISSLAKLLSGQLKEVLSNGTFDVAFEHDGQIMRYVLGHENYRVIREEFFVDGKEHLHRAHGGYGRVFAKEINDGTMVKFQTPDTELSVVNRRDSVQHPFFEPLHQWAMSARHFEFGKTLGHQRLGVLVKDLQDELNERDTAQVVAICNAGLQQFDARFKEAVIRDMGSVGYELEDVGIRRPATLLVKGLLPGDVVGVAVKERELECWTDQVEMSQGMFRALSVIVQLNYAELAEKPLCVLVDDVGEGLDFERSCQMIEVLRRKAQRPSVQLIMSTNDKFVMNKVPLEEWSVLQRQGGHVRVRNYTNSKRVFEEFKFTGLSNFDFLATDFVNEEEAVAHD
jgi:energy-coupling factor transporter ATP-binding protein EcfA2